MRKREKRNFVFPDKQIIPPFKYANLVTFSARKVISFSLADHFLIVQSHLSCKTHFEYEACLECG